MCNVAYAAQVEVMGEKDYDEFVVNLPLHPDAPKRTSPKAGRRLMALMGGGSSPSSSEVRGGAPTRRVAPTGGSGS